MDGGNTGNAGAVFSEPVEAFRILEPFDKLRANGLSIDAGAAIFI
jgi:hypothetical protein